MAGAQKEARYLELYGRPLHPFERLRREKVGYEKQQPQRHLESLRNYLQVASSLAPSQQSWSRPTTRHHDFQPNNVFVSDDLQITGVIDWQNTVILPLFLQGGIPGTLQNHGDGVSERLEIPRLPDDFDELAEDDQLRQVLLLRKRQLHHTYVMATKEANPLHGEVLTDPDCILRRKLFRHAGDPWEGDSVTLKADLLELARRWPQTVRAVDDQSAPPCPIDFIDAEATETTRLLEAFVEADEQMQTCLELVGAGPEGRVPCELYDEVKRRAEQLKSDTLQEAESAEEKSEIEEHWIFADFDESEYL